MQLPAYGVHPPRNSRIDVLRGLSILLVVVHHIGIRVPLSQTLLARFFPPWLLEGLNFNGADAVVIFFVISGFLITRRSHERWGDLRGISIVEFYRLRISRIAPLLLLVVAVLSVFDLLSVPNFIINKPGQSLPGAIASVLGLYLNRYEAIHGYLPGGWDVIWSLSIEEVFYLAFPVAGKLLGRARALAPAVAILALSLPVTRAALSAGSNEIWMEKAYLPGMSAIAVGVLAAITVRRIPRLNPRVAFVMSWAGWAGVCAVLFAGNWVWKLVHHGYGLALAVSAAAIVVGAHWHETNAGRAAPPRGLNWLGSCGRLSYEIYLSHMFCVFGGLALLNVFAPGGSWRFLWYPPILLASWAVGFALSSRFTLPVERGLRGHAKACARAQN
jgi:peptidoglycan/LPS O-acetylase OafA/YrhL